MITKPQQFWTKDVAFYLDGVSFVYKTNPMRDMVAPNPRIWRKRNEELKWTAKGSKGLAGGKRLHLLVAICFGKGLILAEPYEKMNAEFFSRFIQRHYPIMFEIEENGEPGDSKMFVMDNDPSQGSALA